MSTVSLIEVCRKFQTVEECVINLETLRWQGQPTCPHCGSTKHTPYRKERRYRCSDCDTNYSAMVKTLFHGSHVDLRKWYLLIALVMESRRRLPPVKWLASETEVNKNTVTRMVRQIRSAVSSDFNLLVSISDEVQRYD